MESFHRKSNSKWEHVVHFLWPLASVVKVSDNSDTRAGGRSASTLIMFTRHEKKCFTACLRNRAVHSHLPLLEVGGGNGTLLNYLQWHSWESNTVVPNTPAGQCTQKMCLGTELVGKLWSDEQHKVKGKPTWRLIHSLGYGPQVKTENTIQKRLWLLTECYVTSAGLLGLVSIN